DGYRRLASPVNLERSMRLQSGSLLIEDRVQGVCSNAVAFFYLHPSVAVNPLPGAGVLLKLPQGREVHMEFEGNGELAIEPATWHPRFGVVEPNHRIVVTLNGSRLVTRIEWSSQ